MIETFEGYGCDFGQILFFCVLLFEMLKECIYNDQMKFESRA